MPDDPLSAEQRDGALGAIVGALEMADEQDLAELATVLRAGGGLTCTWADDEDALFVNLAVPAGHSLTNLSALEERVFDIASRVIATCGFRVRAVRITLALAKSGWRTAPTGEFPVRLAGRFDREADPMRRGGFGVVYRAKDLATGSEAALKVLQFPKDAGPTVREQYFLRFRREMQLMTRLSHPNVMPVLWYGQETNGFLWYAMPLAEGSLGDRLAEFPDDPNRVLAVMSSICDGVSYLHAQGVIHRDLSPGNVLCMPDGSWVIADLGLAFDLDRDFTQLTITGMTMGTIGYRPPDVEVQMAKTATANWDIYSLGQLLADMADGRTYKERGGATPESIFRPAINRACNVDASRRFAAVDDFLADCRKLVELSTSWEGPQERQAKLMERLRKGDAQAVHELAILVGEGQSIEPFVSKLCAMRREVVSEVAQESPQDLHTLVAAVIDEMPGQWTRFEQLDGMATFVILAAELLKDDALTERSLVWVLETGHEWNRWNVQSQADAFLRRLAGRSLDVVTRALGTVNAEALPEDLEWLHPAARPPSSTGNEHEEYEPF